MRTVNSSSDKEHTAAKRIPKLLVFGVTIRYMSVGRPIRNATIISIKIINVHRMIVLLL